MYVVLWFDTEDYILPASDDSALKIADWLTNEGVKATFKVVGEKARTLERRGRQDVIDALKKHEIGYHSNYHSVQPTPAQYLDPLGWDEGVAEFDRREKPGYDDVKRIFGRAPTCYGQPGSSWAPQSFGAMRKWGMPVYLDSGRHVGLDGRPYYFGGVFTMYQLTHTLRTDLGGVKDLQKAEDRFLEARKLLLAEGGGIVSTYYHPCEFVHKQFWDGANFSKGANPPREKWQLPAAKTEEESRVAYDTFFAYVRFMQRFTDVKFVTASQAREIYWDKAAGRAFTPAEIKRLAAAIGDINYQKLDDLTLAPSEILHLLNTYLVEKNAGRDPKTIELIATPFGPTSASPSMPKTVAVDSSQFLRTAKDVLESLRANGRVPGTVWLGSVGVTPESYLAALASVVTAVADGKDVPARIELTPTKLACAKHVADDDPRLWGWVIFPPGFHAPALMELANRTSLDAQARGAAWAAKLKQCRYSLHSPPHGKLSEMHAEVTGQQERDRVFCCVENVLAERIRIRLGELLGRGIPRLAAQ